MGTNKQRRGSTFEREVWVAPKCADEVYQKFNGRAGQIFRKFELLRNPQHPSLRVHPMDDRDDTFIGYISGSLRVVFVMQGRQVFVVEAGPHSLVDRRR